MRIFMSRNYPLYRFPQESFGCHVTVFIAWYFRLGRCSNTDRSHHLERSKLNFCDFHASNNKRITSREFFSFPLQCFQFGHFSKNYQRRLAPNVNFKPHDGQKKVSP